MTPRKSHDEHGFPLTWIVRDRAGRYVWCGCGWESERGLTSARAEFLSGDHNRRHLREKYGTAIVTRGFA